MNKTWISSLNCFILILSLRTVNKYLLNEVKYVVQTNIDVPVNTNLLYGKIPFRNVRYLQTLNQGAVIRYSNGDSRNNESDSKNENGVEQNPDTQTKNETTPTENSGTQIENSGTQNENSGTQTTEVPIERRSRIETYDELARYRDLNRPPDTHYPPGPRPGYKRSCANSIHTFSVLITFKVFFFLCLINK